MIVPFLTSGLLLRTTSNVSNVDVDNRDRALENRITFIKLLML